MLRAGESAPASADMEDAETVVAQVSSAPAPRDRSFFMKRVRQAGSVSDASPGSPPPAGPAPDAQQKLVVTGAVEISTDDVVRTAAAVRAELGRRGGIIVSDQINGARYGVRADFQVRLLPADVSPFIEWLGGQGAIESSHLSASDVSRDYFDEELRLRTLRAALDRLEKLLADRADVPLDGVLAVEREMTRVRGEIERLEGAHRYLADRVARATLDVHVTTHDQYVAGAPEQKFILVVDGTVLTFADADARRRSRPGAGVSLLVGRQVDLALDVFPSRDGDPRSTLLTLGVAGYSDFLGAGRRRFLNPYLGLRVGGGSFNDRSTFAYGGEAGLELLRHPYCLIDVVERVAGFYYGKKDDLRRSDISFQTLVRVGVPF